MCFLSIIYFFSDIIKTFLTFYPNQIIARMQHPKI